MDLRKCNECDKYAYFDDGVHCDECKRLHAIMWKIRRYQRSFDTPEKHAERERRIPIYARLVTAKVMLFPEVA